MDKNTLIGFGLITAIVIAFGIYSQPSKEELAQQKKQQDSIALVAKKNEAKVKTEAANAVAAQTTLSDSAMLVQMQSQFGSFAGAAQGNKETYHLENEFIKVSISNRGARVASVLLKDYKTYHGKPLELFTEDSSRFAFELPIDGKKFTSDQFYFQVFGETPKMVSGNGSSTLTLRALASPSRYMEVVYSLKGNSYKVDTRVNFVGMPEITKNNNLALNWDVKFPAHEKSITNERNATTIYYRNTEEEVDYLTETSDQDETIEESLDWVSFKNQFFTSVFMPAKPIEKNAKLTTRSNSESTTTVKDASAKLALQVVNNSIDYSFYYGPNKYEVLKNYNKGLERQVPMGWGIFGWVNRFIVLNVFNFFGGFGWNYGLVILCLTIVFKVLLVPFTYKAYLSTAKMKVLKPEVDEINKKFEGGDPLAKQQAVMGLYRSAGVNPMGGCLPMLFQLPILIALFRFFPSSIELRQQSFLWAEDLSTYDSIVNFGFHIPGVGDHLSLFALLMTITTIIYTQMNNQMAADDPNMKIMKWMMYLMPVIFFGVMNSSSSGLSYYYFIANIFTFTQQWVMRKMVNDTELYAKIQDNKKKPATKSKFQERLEEMAKQRGVQLPNQGKK